MSTSADFLEDGTNFLDFDFSSNDTDGSESFYVEVDEPANGTVLRGKHRMVSSDLMQVRLIMVLHLIRILVVTSL